MEAYTHALMRQMRQMGAAQGPAPEKQGPAPTFDTAAASAGMRETIPGYAESAAYTAGARPGYQEFGPNGQFYQPIYQPTYTDYHNPEGIAALGWGEEWGRDWGRG